MIALRAGDGGRQNGCAGQQENGGTEVEAHTEFLPNDRPPPQFLPQLVAVCNIDGEHCG
jgi:hypothetical protein